MSKDMAKLALGIGAMLLLATLGAMCVAHPGHPPIPTPTITVSAELQSVPFELFRGNRIVVPARINGHETHVLLDTGASLSTLNRSYARSIGLPQGFKIQAKGAGGDTDAELVSGLTIQLGGYRAQNASVGVMDLATIERSIGMPITAIVGRDFFNSAVVSIDWAGKRLRISSPDAFRPESGATAVELGKMGPFNTIPVSIAGAPAIPALLDLGNGGALALPRTYWGGRPELASLRSAASTVGGVGGMHAARAALVPQVTLAGATFASVPALLSESGNDSDPAQMANVGIGLLRQFKVDFDLGRGRIFLTPRSDRPEFVRERAGVRFDLAGDRLKTAFVSPDGPAAAAGLKEGDDIVAVDGRAVTPAYYQAVDWTRGPAGKSVILTRADGSKVTVKLADYY
jgi:hypothetical protein